MTLVTQTTVTPPATKLTRRLQRVALHRCARAVICGALIGGQHGVEIVLCIISAARTVRFSVMRYGASTLLYAEQAGKRTAIHQIVDGNGAVHQQLTLAGIPPRRLAHPGRLTAERRRLHSSTWRWQS